MQNLDLKFAKYYKLIKKIGSGAFGDVYVAQHIHTKEMVAVKLEEVGTPAPQLEYESNLYKLLQGKGKHPFKEIV
jgi:serine/threonine protein kinase